MKSTLMLPFGKYLYVKGKRFVKFLQISLITLTFDYLGHGESPFVAIFQAGITNGEEHVFGFICAN